jgi:toxin-antitoxin system PIN domain toxin
MNGLLLDVNVLIALLWPDHAFHKLVQGWFGRNALRGWATCPITQAGFVRIVSNPAFSPRSVLPTDALLVLDLTLQHPAHQFWADNVPLIDALKMVGARLVGHQQITDAYLLGLAIHKKGKLATLDQSVGDLFSRGDPRADIVELISGKQ